MRQVHHQPLESSPYRSPMVSRGKKTPPGGLPMPNTIHLSKQQQQQLPDMHLHHPHHRVIHHGPTSVNIGSITENQGVSTASSATTMASAEDYKNLALLVLWGILALGFSLLHVNSAPPESPVALFYNLTSQDPSSSAATTSATSSNPTSATSLFPKVTPLTFKPQILPVILSRKLPKAYRMFDEVPMNEFIAFEVRRYRRDDIRETNESIVPFADAGRKRKQARNKLAHLEKKFFKSSKSRWFREDISTLASAASSSSSKDSPALNVGPRRTLSKAFLRSPLMDRLIVSEHHKTVFCPNPGVASRAWLSALNQTAVPYTVDPSLLQDVPSEMKSNPAFTTKGYLVSEPSSLTNYTNIARLSDYSERDRERFLNRSDFVRFMFVRNPYDRLLSVFLHASENEGLESKTYRDFVGDFRAKALNPQENLVQKLSFSVFLVLISKRSPDSLTGLLTPQTAFCGNPNLVSYDFVGRFESLQQDVQTVMKKFIKNDAGWSDIKNDNELRLPTREELTIPPQFTPEKLDWALNQTGQYSKSKIRIKRSYIRDFEAFGYSK